MMHTKCTVNTELSMIMTSQSQLWNDAAVIILQQHRQMTIRTIKAERYNIIDAHCGNDITGQSHKRPIKQTY